MRIGMGPESPISLPDAVTVCTHVEMRYDPRRACKGVKLGLANLRGCFLGLVVCLGLSKRCALLDMMIVRLVESDRWNFNVQVIEN